MSQDNASFTFLHRIEEVELNIEDGRWQSALALALTLPDICGGIAFPEIVSVIGMDVLFWTEIRDQPVM